MSLEQYKFNNNAIGIGIFGLCFCFIQFLSGYVWYPSRLDLISFISRVEDHSEFYEILIFETIGFFIFLLIGFYIKWLNK